MAVVDNDVPTASAALVLSDLIDGALLARTRLVNMGVEPDGLTVRAIDDYVDVLEKHRVAFRRSMIEQANPLG